MKTSNSEHSNNLNFTEKQARLQRTPTKNAKTYEWPKFIQLVPYIKKSHNLIYRENFGAKTEEPHWQTACNNWTNLLLLWMLIHYAQNQHHSTLVLIFCRFNPSRPDPGRKEKINLNFYFHTSLWCLKMFYEGFLGLHKPFWGTTKKCKNKNLR